MESVFVGRETEMRRLQAMLETVSSEGSHGKALLMRGRRRVGKSRLVEEFVERAGVSSFYYAAVGRTVREELRLFAQEAADSSLPGADLFRGVELASWDAALRLLVSALPSGAPSIVVFDELQYLIDRDPGLEGTMQRIFDREFSRRPALFIGIGSDLAMMETLNSYGRPFHQRAREMVVPALTPAEVGMMIGLDAADAFDAYLVTGGLPLICMEWDTGMLLEDFLTQTVSDPTSPMLVSAERSLAAEFPSDAQARTVLSAIGSGERTFTNIGRAAGEFPQASLSRSLNLLQRKRIVAAELPLSTRSSRDKRYRVEDPYLRFWLQFLGSRIGEIERGRGDRVLASILRGWSAWRGRAIEPVVRDALARLSPPELLDPEGVPAEIGAYWTRTNNPEIDLVAGDSAPVAKRITALGSIKWLERATFDQHDLGELQRHRSQLPGASVSTPLVAVSRSGVSVEGITSFGPADLLAGY